MGLRGGGDRFGGMQAKDCLHMVTMSMSVRLSSIGVNKALGIEEWNLEQFWANDTNFKGTRIKESIQIHAGKSTEW